MKTKLLKLAREYKPLDFFLSNWKIKKHRFKFLFSKMIEFCRELTFSIKTVFFFFFARDQFGETLQVTIGTHLDDSFKRAVFVFTIQGGESWKCAFFFTKNPRTHNRLCVSSSSIAMHGILHTCVFAAHRGYVWTIVHISTPFYEDIMISVCGNQALSQHDYLLENHRARHYVRYHLTLLHNSCDAFALTWLRL